MTDAVFSFRFFIATFGCRLDQYESQALREHWTRLGGRETDDAALADVLLIASCAVTAEAVADARQTARKWGRAVPSARIVVTGCAASAAPGDFSLPGVVAVVPQIRKADLLQLHPLELTGEKGRNFAPPRASAGVGQRARPGESSLLSALKVFGERALFSRYRTGVPTVVPIASCL